MKFTRELPGTLTIRSVGPEGIRINDQLWSGSIAITTTNVLPEWPAKPVNELCIDDFNTLLSVDTELVLLGTGERSEFPPRELVFAFARLHVGLETMETRAAVRTFNILAGEGRQVAAVLIQP